MSMVIPKVIFQTSIVKQPQYVIDMIMKQAPGWEYKHFTDEEIIQYMINNPLEEFSFILKKFHQLQGAFKADLFRYYYIYNEGGVFLDSDAMIEVPLDTIVKDYAFFSVNSYIEKTVFQGFIGAVPRNQIMYEALKDAYQIDMAALQKDYHLLCANMYKFVYGDKHGDKLGDNYGKLNHPFKYKLYNELNGDSGIGPTKNDEGDIILLHHWGSKIIPTADQYPALLENIRNGINPYRVKDISDTMEQIVELTGKELFKHTLYINLEHRKDRLEHVTSELSKLGIVGERFEAVKTKVGAIGCSMSHIKCLELAKARDYDHVFICEDDITFLKPDVLKNSVNQFYKNKDIEWDMLLIGGNNVPPYDKVTDYCIRVYYCQTTTGYIVKKHYYDTLISNFRESVQNLIREPENKSAYALDMYWKRLQLINKWYMIIPITVTQCESYSDIEERTVDYTHLMLDVDKPWLNR